jgi:hypothetical protein
VHVYFQSLCSCIICLAFGVRLSWFVPLWVTAFIALVLPLVFRLSRPIVPVSYTWRVKEGDLRFAHARQREYCEAVAFYGGQEGERYMLVWRSQACGLCCMWNVGCRVSGVDCGLWNVCVCGGGGWSVECGLGLVACGLWIVDCGVWGH